MKKFILIISGILSIAIFILEKISMLDFCKKDYECRGYFIGTGETFLFFVIVFFFSLITYFAPEKVFQSWWKFAKFSIPIIFLLSLAINLELHHSPTGSWQDIFDIPAQIILYSVFTLGSTWQIWKGWRKN